MPNWGEKDLEKQFKRLSNAGWMPFFTKAGADYLFDPLLLISIASRETNIRNIVGDGGHGYGIMQIDDRSFPDWCHSGVWKDPEQAILKGAHVLDGKRNNVRLNQGKKVAFGSNSFVGKPDLSEDEILEITISSYNCGWWAYYNVSKGRDVDASSTGKDYCRDTLNRLAVFKQQA